MSGEKLSRGERERIVTFLKENPLAGSRSVAHRFQRSAETIRKIKTEEGLIRKGKTGPAPGGTFEVFKRMDHGYVEKDTARAALERRMRFEDDPDIPRRDAYHRAW